jgi:hypothetical protein
MRYDPSVAGTLLFACRKELLLMFSFLIGLAIVVMVLGPAILASMQHSSHDLDL